MKIETEIEIKIEIKTEAEAEAERLSQLDFLYHVSDLVYLVFCKNCFSKSKLMMFYNLFSAITLSLLRNILAYQKGLRSLAAVVV